VRAFIRNVEFCDCEDYQTPHVQVIVAPAAELLIPTVAFCIEWSDAMDTSHALWGAGDDAFKKLPEYRDRLRGPGEYVPAHDEGDGELEQRWTCKECHAHPLFGEACKCGYDSNYAREGDYSTDALVAAAIDAVEAHDDPTEDDRG